MAIDPVCGMEIDEDEAKGSSDYEGETFYFCSQSCKQKFDRDPEAYLEEGADELSP